MLAAGKVGHYIFISSYKVYPANAHLRPWIEEDSDVASDLPPWADEQIVIARAVERELRLCAGGQTPFTILRPAPVEGGGTDLGMTAWFAARILDGELLVLPEGDLPTYRVASPGDLAQAVVTVAGKEACFGRALNVANPGILSYWGHAAMLRDGLGKALRFAYVPEWRWRAAGLSLPGNERLASTLMATSRLLLDLGWKPQDPVKLFLDRAQQLDLTKVNRQTIEIERRVLAESEACVTYQPGVPVAPLPVHETRQWRLKGWAGHPASLSLERSSTVHSMPLPLLKVLALPLQAPEDRFLRGEYPQHGARALGHNAILEVLSAEPGDLAAGTHVLPVAAMPCDDAACRFCAGGRHGVVGIGCDGYGLGVCSTPSGHLVPVPETLGVASLLADPLACLMSKLITERFAADREPVWIAGRTAEAALAAWLAIEAGRHVVHVDRRDWSHAEFPVQAVDPLLERVRKKEIAAPTLVIDFTGAADVAWSLSHALAQGGHMFVRRRPPGIAHGIYWHELPAAAPDRQSLEGALRVLTRWQSFRNLKARIGPAVPLDLYWDAFLPSPFSLPYLEASR